LILLNKIYYLHPATIIGILYIFGMLFFLFFHNIVIIDITHGIIKNTNKIKYNNTFLTYPDISNPLREANNRLINIFRLYEFIIGAVIVTLNYL